MKTLISSIKWEYLKWGQSVKTHLAQAITYKVDFLLTTIAPILVFFFIKYNLWTSIYIINDSSSIKGYTLKAMISYQIWILIFDLFANASYSLGQNLAEKIRLGRISAFLLYPFGFIKYQFTIFLSDKILQFFSGFLIFSFCLAFDFLTFPHVLALTKALLFVLLVSGFWFLSQTAIGLMALWLEETWSLNACIRIIVVFFSGSLLPMELYPQIFQRILEWTPFPYLAYFPVKILMGEEVPFLFGFSILACWTALLSLFVLWLWRRGLKLYTGAGI